MSEQAISEDSYLDYLSTKVPEDKYSYIGVINDGQIKIYTDLLFLLPWLLS